MRSRLRSVLLATMPPFAVDGLRSLRRAWRRKPESKESSEILASAGRPESDDATCSAQARQEDFPEWEMVSDTDELWSSAAGWGHQSIVETQLAKWPSFLDSVAATGPLGQSHEAATDAPADYATHNTIMTFGYALGRAARGRDGLTVLDWGGGLGHYYVYARALFPDLPLDYVVKDLLPFCEVGPRLLPEVAFVTDADEALSKSYDFVFASSSIHYERDQYQLLGRLCDSATAWLLVTRTPFVEASDDFLVVQRPHQYGYLTEYPGWFMNRRRFIEFVAARGFNVEREFLVAEQPYVPNAPETAHYLGFLFRRSSS